MVLLFYSHSRWNSDPISGNRNITGTGKTISSWVGLVANNITATMPMPGQTFNVACQAWNNSNSTDKIYQSIPWTLQLIGPAGAIVQSASGTIASINQGQTITLNNTFTAPSVEAVYQLIFYLNTNRDANYANNSFTRTLTVSSTGPQLQWIVNGVNGWVQLSPSTNYNFAGSTWNYLGNNSSYASLNETLVQQFIK